MKIIKWLTNHFSRRGKALGLYRRGMNKANRRDHQGALHDYTAAIGMQDAPADVRAMALYNRALIHTAMGNLSSGAEDLEEVMTMDEAPRDVKKRAKEKLAKRKSKSQQAG